MVNYNATVYSKVPVFDDNSSLNYQNIYCAICHNVDINNIQMWPFRYYPDCVCNVTDKHCIKNTTTLFNKNICKYYFLWTNITPCLNQYTVDTCLPDYSEYIKKCKTSAMSTVVNSRFGTTYRNHFCAYCNGISDLEPMECHVDDSSFIRSSTIKTISLSSIIDFTSEALLQATKYRSLLHLPIKLFNNNNTNVTNITSNSLASTDKSLISFYASLTSIAVSAIMIFILLFIVFTHTNLRNKNVKLVQYLAVCILLSNTSYIILSFQFQFNYSIWFCRVVAVSHYFLTMSTFTSSLAIGVDLCTMLYGMISSFTCAKLCVVSTAASGLLTIIATLVDIIIPQWSFAPKFGMNTCWINSMKGHILFYYSPAAINVLTNIG